MEDLINQILDSVPDDQIEDFIAHLRSERKHRPTLPPAERWPTDPEMIRVFALREEGQTWWEIEHWQTRPGGRGQQMGPLQKRYYKECERLHLDPATRKPKDAVTD